MTRLAKQRKALNEVVNELVRTRAWADKNELILASVAVVRQLLVRKAGELIDEVEFADGSVATVAFHETLMKLEVLNGMRARVVELQFYGGMTDEESAEVLGLSVGAAHEHSVAAKGWIAARMQALAEFK